MKLLLLTDSYMQDGSLDPFRQEVLSILSSYSSSTKCVVTNHFLRNNSSSPLLSQGLSKVITSIKEFNPDIIFSINRAGLIRDVINAVSPETIKISWFIDSYERVSDQLLQFEGNEIVWLTGKGSYAKNFCDKYKISKDKIIFSPFASNTNIFYPHAKNRTIDGCFVGTAFSNNSFVSTLNTICRDTKQRDLFLSVFNDHKQQYIFNLQASLKERGFKLHSESSRDVWQAIFDDQISIEKRVLLLSNLDSFNIKIYGEPDESWIRYLSISNSNMLEKYQYEPIRKSTDLANLYNVSKIGINIQHYQASNHSSPIRVFDIMACKTLLLTEKSSSVALNEIGFVEDIDFVCFENGNDLRDKFQFYLKNEEARSMIVDSAYSKVLEYHNLELRIYNALSQSLGNVSLTKTSLEGTFEMISGHENLKTSSLSSRSEYLSMLKNRFPKTWESLRLSAIKLNLLR